MAEIIELSSSPLTVNHLGSFARCLEQDPLHRPDKGQERNPHFSSDEFNSSIFDDPEWFEPPGSKRRKLSSLEKENRPVSPILSKERPAPSHKHGKDIPGSKRIIGTVVAEIKTADQASFAWDDDFLSDPIIFTSSAPEARASTKATLQDGDDYENSSDAEIFSLSQPTAASQVHLSERTAILLANMGTGTQQDEQLMSTAKLKLSRGRSFASQPIRKGSGPLSIDEIVDSSPPKPPDQNPNAKFSNARKKAENQSLEVMKAIKDREKDEEKERKRLAKEQKVKEKQLAADIAEVNKSKTDKKNSTPEMILDISICLQGTSLGNQVSEYMKQLGAESHFSTVLPEGYPLIQWRRKTSSRFDEDLGHWVPAPERIDREKHVFVHMLADTFASLATADRGDSHAGSSRTNIEAHVANIKRSHPLCRPIYLIEGLSAWMRKNKNAQNRAYQAAVRAQAKMQGEGLSRPSQLSQSQQKRSDQPAIVDEDLIEDALLQLQVEEDCLIHQTTCTADSAYWIKNFTEHISTIPYRQERITANEATAFCMDVGQVKTGDDAKDTYVKMLQEVQRVTPAMAFGVASEYPNVKALMNGFKKHGPNMLQDVKKSANKDGAVSDTRLGPKVSKRLFKVFTGLDPTSIDGIA